ncbi:hypothetical protein HAX54_015147 [Datura stramonium]|uniref:Uncharacterized protein n=1 Tax=Datura stramonium TaxID=4076 RepID=A0ABS8RZ70_DATST|nr:hypothetical protein [Datura stramonium]
MQLKEVAKAISQLAPTQKRKLRRLIAAFENVVPPQGSNIHVTFLKLKTKNEDNLHIVGKRNALVSNADNVRARVDKRNAEDDWLSLENDNAQKAIVVYQKLDEITSTSSDKVSVEEKSKQQIKEYGHSKLEPKAQINISKIF